MGREIRKVPRGWEHPKNWRGEYQPMHDRSYSKKAEEWLKNCLAWSKGEHEDQKEDDISKKYKYYWEWTSNPPDKNYYRPDWKEEEMTCFQVYENVSEGTPISPVFETKSEMRSWLINNGWTPSGADMFIGGEYQPSGIMIAGVGMVFGNGTSNLLAEDK